MSKVLVIAEKPSAGKDIARTLGVTEMKKGYMENDSYIVTWARGHLVGLKDPEENDERYKKWNVEDLPLPYDNGLKVLTGARDQFMVIKTLIQRDDISYLINAGDAGREGLLIQSWIYRMCKNRHPVRILWASSLTDEAIKNAMNNLHDENESEFVKLLREAETRAIADQVYGYNYTRALTCLYSSPGTVLSYGRCQTPLLNLIYTRDMEIEHFKSVPYWTLHVEFENGFLADEIDDEGNNKKYLEKQSAETACQNCGKIGHVKVCKKELKSAKAPALYNLAEIQSVMGKKYGLKPDETLDIAQKLYETYKILSYPRTDSRYMSTDLYDEIAQHVKSCSFGKFSKYIAPIDFTDIPMDKAYFNNNKVSDHHALIPTINNQTEDIYNKLSDMERNFFDEIVVSLIAVFYPSYQYETTEIVFDVSGKNFLTKGTIIKEIGYKAVFSLLKSSDNTKDTEQSLPALSEGQELVVQIAKLKESMTKPPKRYSPGNIVKLMNKYKIGTSATSANIIKTLEKRKFIILDNKKKYYQTTELGRTFLNLVPDILKSKNLTIEFESKLSKVNSGEITQEQFLQEIICQIRTNIEKFRKNAPAQTTLGNVESIGSCPICGKPMRESSKSWYCSGYKDEPKCGFTIWKKICGKTLAEANAKKLLVNHRTDLIKGFKSSQGREFSAYVILKDDFTSGFEFPSQK